MRTGLYIPQQAIVEKGLLGKVPTDAWLLLDYLRRWVDCKKLKTIQVQGQLFFWIRYAHAVEELPILFPRRPTLRTKINKMTKLVASLKKNGLIDTALFDSRCYVRITEKAHELYVKPKTPPVSHLAKECVTSHSDSADMKNYDGSVTLSGDGYKEEQYTEEQYNTQNGYSNEELECVRRRLETIFPKTNWSNVEISLLKTKMPIPEWELTLMQRFYQLSGKNESLPGNKLSQADFFLARRRQTLKALLENWSVEVDRAHSFFATSSGHFEMFRRNWDLAEMQPPIEKDVP